MKTEEGLRDMLTLPIKRKWFDMILSGGKKEEYREIKPYYQQRFCRLFGMAEECGGSLINAFEEDPERAVRFRNGYGSNSPSFIARCSLSVGTGREEWGAEPGKRYFVLTVREILDATQVHSPSEWHQGDCGGKGKYG